MKNWQERNQRQIGRALAVIRRLPFTRAIMLTGSVAEGRATELSDIDFFIQVEPGHLWSTRFFVTALLQLIGLRRTDHQIAGRICLNWFGTGNLPAKQEGRVYQALWQEKGPNGFKLGLEKLLSRPIGSISFAQRAENWLKGYQVDRIERDPRTHLPGSQVRYSDQELGFHPPKPL